MHIIIIIIIIIINIITRIIIYHLRQNLVFFGKSHFMSLWDFVVCKANLITRYRVLYTITYDILSFSYFELRIFSSWN
jgi:hypothetical protein